MFQVIPLRVSTVSRVADNPVVGEYATVKPLSQPVNLSKLRRCRYTTVFDVTPTTLKFTLIGSVQLVREQAPVQNIATFGIFPTRHFAKA